MRILKLFISLTLLISFELQAGKGDKEKAIETVSNQLLKKLYQTSFYKDLKSNIVFETSTKKTKKMSNSKERTEAVSEKRPAVQTSSPATSYSLDVLKQRGEIVSSEYGLKTEIKLNRFQRLSASVEKKNFGGVDTKLDLKGEDFLWKLTLDKKISDEISSKVSTTDDNEVHTGVFFNLGF